MSSSYSLDGKIAIVTGAGSGVGRAIALELSRLKMHICMLDISKERMEETSQEIKVAGVKVDSFLCDVSSEEQVSDVFKEIEKGISCRVLTKLLEDMMDKLPPGPVRHQFSQFSRDMKAMEEKMVVGDMRENLVSKLQGFQSKYQ